MTEVIGIDHVYLAVTDMARSEDFYRRLLEQALGFRSNRFTIAGDDHLQFYNRHFGIVLRPARVAAPHQPYAPGLHHLCLRVDTAGDVHAAAARLRELGIAATEPACYPEYAPDYVATFCEDPDGIRLELANYRAERRERHDRWQAGA